MPGRAGGPGSGELVDRVRQHLVQLGDAAAPMAGDGPAGLTASQVAVAVRDQSAVLGDRAVLDVVGRVLPELGGAGRLDSLLRDPLVTDVLVNGPDQVWVDRGDGLVRTRVRFPDEGSVRRLAQRLAAAAGRRLDDACPYADARLPGGIRMHAVLPPIATGGTCVSLRVLRRRSFSLDELVAAGSVPAEGARWLRAVVAARLAFLVSGGTGSGKTTVLAGLLSLVDPDERIVLVEDAGELQPDHPHVVRLEARPANLEGAGAVVLRDLVRQALRMRPDRLVVGEVRGAEVVDLLAALNTGHDGGCGTVHANGPADVPPRMEALATAGGLGRDAVHAQLAAAVAVVIHLVRERSGLRRVCSVSVLDRAADGLVVVVPAVEFRPDAVVARDGVEVLVKLLGARGVSV
ncbi:MAG: TadA family conjugal transfer-associated ATPase [Sporichthyaceae bacterium]|nr:TadA family conjugal transfer-associated ATPase [Sporichthyaceae bacterium]